MCVCVWERERERERESKEMKKMRHIVAQSEADVWSGGRKEFTHHIPLIAHSMWGHKGCAHREWPQGKASQLGRNAGTGALCRSCCRRTLGAVMSAGHDEMGVQWGLSVGAHHPPHAASTLGQTNTCSFIFIHASTYTVTSMMQPNMRGIPAHIPPRICMWRNCHACWAA